MLIIPEFLLFLFQGYINFFKETKITQKHCWRSLLNISFLLFWFDIELLEKDQTRFFDILKNCGFA